MVLMLDDIQVGYYDSEVDQVTRVRGAEELDLGQEARFVLQDMFSNMKKRLTWVRHRFNLTAPGVHVQQRLTGCEALDNRPALIMFRDGWDGRDADSLMYNMTHFTFAGSEGGDVPWSGVKRLHFQVLYSNVYLPFCVRTLQHLLDHEKHLVARRVRPRVRFIARPSEGGGGGVQVTCLATEFYPRHINLTLLRDGRTPEDGELTVGPVLPNGNGLYQVRKTLTVSDEELQRKHNYTCTAAHLSLDNRLEVSWRARASRSHRVLVLSAPASLTLAAGLTLWLLWCRRRRASPWKHHSCQETQGRDRGGGSAD